MNIRYGGYNPNTMTIISGGAEGVDKYAIDIAKRCGVKTDDASYLPDMSSNYNVAQYHIRNDKLIHDADQVIAFWDGKSRGTESVIKKCLERHKNIQIIFDKAEEQK